MSVKTTNYQLTKPEENDYYDVNVPNGNMDVIDAELKKAQNHRENTANPHQVTAVQAGAVQGNTKSWVATAVTMADSNQTFDVTIPNFIFSEDCHVTFFAPMAPIGSGWSNVKINGGNNGIWRLRLLSHENLSGYEWAANTSVTVNISTKSIPNDTNGGNGTAFFKGGVSVKEPYDFPLSIQTATPTPVNSNHIWVHTDTKPQLFVVDEAIRAGDWDGVNNVMYALMDTTDNNYIHDVAPKTLTDGTHTTVVNRHMGRDVPNPIWLAGGVNYAKKYEINYTMFGGMKPPRIYSRINGVVDLEDAQRWDGAAWQWLSQKGKYVFALLNSGSGLNHFEVYNRIGSALNYEGSVWLSQGFWGGADIKASVDGVYIVILRSYSSSSSAPRLTVVKRNGDIFTEVFNYTPTHGLATFYRSNVSITSDGMYIAIALDAGVEILKKNPNDTYSLLGTLETVSTSKTCAFSPDNNYLAICRSDGYRTIYHRQGDAFGSGIYSHNEIGSALGNGPVWDDDSKHCAFPNESNYLDVYNNINGTFGINMTHQYASSRVCVFIGHNMYVAYSGLIRCVNVDSGALVIAGFAPSGLSGSIHDMCKSADGKYIYIIADNSSILVLQVNSDGTLTNSTPYALPSAGYYNIAAMG